MATIDNKQIIDDIIAANGYYEDDPRVAKIVEYTNFAGNITWGVTWSNQIDQDKYLIISEFVRGPKLIWEAD